MSTETTAEVFREVDVCRSLFDTIAYELENDACVGEYHPLSVFSGQGRRMIADIVDEIDQEQMAA